MLPDMKIKLQEQMILFMQYLSTQRTLQEDVGVVGSFLKKLLPIRQVALISSVDQNVQVWQPEDVEGSPKQLEEVIRAQLNELLLRGSVKAGMAEGIELNRMLGLEPMCPVLLCTIRYGGKEQGLLLVQREEGFWTEDERGVLRLVGGVLGAPFAVGTSVENEKLLNFVFNTVLNSMNASICITDVHTHKIIFMNQTMKQAFGLEHPEGQHCWEVLQRGMSGPCATCPVQTLLEAEDGQILQWDENSPVNGRKYHKYDSLIHWVDGSIVHMQQSIDVTDIQAAYTDDLTSVMTRRAGKAALAATLDKARRQGTPFTVCMYDINNLKLVNDQFGHAEGDRLLCATARAVSDHLSGEDYAFRLSGDEFIAVLCCSYRTAQKRIEKAVEMLQEESADYAMGFCYGLIEVQPNEDTTVDEILFLADERMYVQKRSFHILRNERELATMPGLDEQQFSYNEQLLYETLVNSTDDYIYIGNMKTGVFRYSKSMVEEFALPGEIIPNAATIWGAKVHENDREAFLEANQEIADGRAMSHCVEYRALNRRGEWVWVRCRGYLQCDENGEPLLFAGFITNLGQKTRIDNMTGLFNKAEFEAQAERLIEVEKEGRFALLVLGIDDLKQVNDLYDRTFGDEVIRITAQKLRSLLPTTASLFRLSGDEFGVLVRGAGKDAIEQIRRALHHGFGNQQQFDRKKYYCTVSGGCAFYPDDATDFPSLFKFVGYALEYAKVNGKKQITCFSKELMLKRKYTLTMVEELRESIEHDFAGFSLRYQPLVQASSGKLVGLEVLARWECDRFGMVSPVEFIPLLEQTGMIIQVGKWVFQEALRTSKAWCSRMPDLIVDINLSYHQIEGDDFVPFMRQVIQEEGYSPRNLVVEMTESYFAQRNEHAETVFADIRRLGVRIAMDDFGTGYSTLGILKRTPADVVKIDRTFIRDILSSNFDATFIRFVVALCHDVGIKVCLEGVETEEEYCFVRSMGLDTIQGFYFSKPLSRQAFEEKYFS